jgi:hypothetical protein
MGGFRWPGRFHAEPRLDPVRRRPGRATLFRLIAVAALLVAAAGVIWSQPQGCAPPPPARAHSPAPPSIATAPPGGTRDSRGPEVPPGSVGVPIRLAEPTALALVHAGDKVDLLSVGASGGGPTPVAAAALVLSVTAADDPTTGGLLLALKPMEARRAVAGAGHGFAVLIRPG